MAVTAQGRVLAYRARAVKQIHQLSGEMMRTLHVAAVPVALMWLAPEALRTCSASCPGIRLRIDEKLYMG